MSNVVDMSDHYWRRNLKVNSKEHVTAEIGNAYLMLTNGIWRGCLGFDSFANSVFWAKTPPALADFTSPQAGDVLRDRDAVYVQHYLSRIGAPAQVSFKVQTIQEAIIVAAQRNALHPLQNYLNGLAWDGVQRLNTWLHRYAGCDDTPYHADIGRMWMVSAVARALNPGVKVDTMLILQGVQGLRKTSLLEVLGGRWFLPELGSVTNKDTKQSLMGKWIVECAELDAMQRSEITAVKTFLTIREDFYRLPYARTFQHQPRSVCFAGTTNSAQPFNDATGARRFWPATCTRIDIPAALRDRDQLWAEAVARFEVGEQWHPSTNSLVAIQLEQADRYEPDIWTDKVLGWVHTRLTSFTTAEIATGPLNLEIGKVDRQTQSRIGKILAHAGYVARRGPVTPDGSRPRAYDPKLPREPGEEG